MIFNHLTGLSVSCANYAGTTVEFVAGKTKIGTREWLLVDVPGTYTLQATNQAEQVAVDMLRGRPRPAAGPACAHCRDGTDVCAEDLSARPAAVICVVDANNLESSLYHLFQVMEYRLPTVLALNRIDLARDKNVEIDADKLSAMTGLPVVPMVAIEKKGFPDLVSAVDGLVQNPREPLISWEPGNTDLWKKAEEMARSVCTSGEEKKPPRRRVWGERLVRPWPGLPLAILILALSFALVVGIGMQLRQLILLPLFRGAIIPRIVSIVEALVAPGMIRNIMVEEYGFLVKRLEWPFTLVMPYVLSFYGVMAALEDSGYLPRPDVLGKKIWVRLRH